jgi:hypothetical protein
MKVSGSTFFLFLCFLFSAVKTQAQQIKYEKGTVKEVLAKAKTEGKPVFIHLLLSDRPRPNPAGGKPFTSALESPAVAKAFNAQFLNVLVRWNTQQGSELIRQYKVKQYPTYLYLSADGNLIHRSTSNSSSPQKYLNDLKAFRENLASTHNLSYFQKEYEQGRSPPIFWNNT